jgi:hypothetical protein
MSGRPYTYSRSMAIAQLMVDRRRPVIKKAEEDKKLRRVYLYGNDLFVDFQDTIDWVPKLSKLTKDGVWFGDTPIAGWPTEEEIAACIAESAEREKAGGGLSVNDLTAMQRALG